MPEPCEDARVGAKEAVQKKHKSKSYPVDQSPVPRFDQKRKLVQQAAQKSILEDARVWRRHAPTETKQLKLALSPAAFLRRRRGKTAG